MQVRSGRILVAATETLNKLTEQGASLVRGPWLIVLLFGTHLFLTVRTGFMQRHHGHDCGKFKNPPVCKFGRDFENWCRHCAHTGIAYPVLGGISSISKFCTIVDFSDVVNGLMTIPNIVALLLLSGVIVAEPNHKSD